MKVVRKIIQIDEELCDGCGQCVTGCAEGALEIQDGKARVLSDNLCDGLGACIGDCPTGALEIIEREADPFDEEAVEALLAHKTPQPTLFPTGGCPSAGLRVLAPAVPDPDAMATEAPSSTLGHWPIKIRLVPPTAPFLKGADLLVLADCGAAAFPALHQTALKGKVVMMGCPKFDDVDKFTDIFANAGVRSITLMRMEVPCCAGLFAIVEKALKNANAAIPVEEIVITVRGRVAGPGA
ncbi:MAG: 4Fe-4S binding protein [Desulfobacterales bacterium]|jgi:Fe-S-cluster-containing hydrogenase component 2